MKRSKRTFSQGERGLIFVLWKQGSGFSDIGRVINAKTGSIFTVLRDAGGIKKPEVFWSNLTGNLNYWIILSTIQVNMNTKRQYKTDAVEFTTKTLVMISE